MEGMTQGFTDALSGLARRDGRLFLEREGEEPVEMTVRYLRPLTSRHEVVFIDAKGREVASLRGLDALPPAERPLVEAALREGYLLPEIRSVDRVDARFGTRYWWVTTDRGERCFALREPGKNVIWVSASHLILRDTAGNRYEVPDLGALDRRSRRWIGLSL